MSSMSREQMENKYRRMVDHEAGETAKRLSGKYDKEYAVLVQHCDHMISNWAGIPEETVDELRQAKDVLERAASTPEITEDTVRAAMHAIRYYRNIYEQNGGATGSAFPATSGV